MDKDLRDMYKKEEKRVRDYINTMNSQKEKGYNIGLKKGYNIGLEEGLKKVII